MNHFPLGRAAIVWFAFLLIFPQFMEAAELDSAVTRIAVATLEAKEGVSASMAELISDGLRTELYKTGAFEVMNREDMNLILKEVSFHQTEDCLEISCVAEMGQALGVGKMVTGSLGLIGNKHVINVKLIDVAKFKSEVLVTEYWSVKRQPTGILKKVARKLSRPIEKRKAPRKKPKASQTQVRESEETTAIAVMSFEAKEGISKSMAELMTDMLRTEVYKTGKFEVMNREDMNLILKEVSFQQSGACLETTCIVEMGQALGVPKIISGSLGLVGKNIVINAKLIDVATAKNEVLVTEYLPKNEAINPQQAFQNVALQLAGLKRITTRDRNAIGAFFVMGTGSSLGVGISPLTVSGTEGMVNYSAEFSSADILSVGEIFGFGARYYLRPWLMVELSYYYRAYQGHIQLNVSNDGSFATDISVIPQYRADGWMINFLWVKRFPANLRLFLGAGGGLIVVNELQTNNNPASLEWETGGDRVTMEIGNLSLVKGKFTETNQDFVRIGLKTGWEWRPQERIGLAVMGSFFPLKSEAAYYSHVTAEGSINGTIFEDDLEVFRIGLPRVTVEFTLALYF